MNQTPTFTLPTYLRAGIFAPFAFALLLACGSDIDAPSDPTTTTSGGGGATSGTSAQGGEGGSGGSVGTGGDGGEGLCTIPANATVGLLKHTSDSFGGYTLLAPNGSTRSYLLDECGQVVHQWQHGSRPGQSTYLLENGDLLRAEKVGGMTFKAGGSGGRVVRHNWEGDTLWTFAYSTDTYRQHHDVELLPNGNVLLIAWEKKTAAEATAAGRDPSLLAQNELWPDHIIEVAPEGPADGKIVWRWNSWDHLIQEHDPNQANYGAPSEHPELIDINFANNGNADWLHINSIDYNAAHDQIILSAHNLNEVWIIDHSTTSSEAASHQGGNSGKGGDLLYRWGNPQTYGAGTSTDERLFGQHDAQWIGNGLSGAGEVLIFNNGANRPEGDYSTVEQIALPVDANGQYSLLPDGFFGPTDPTWLYKAEPATDFFSRNISGAQRLANGNTMVCSGANGTLFEVSEAGDVVWQYLSPSGAMGQIVKQGESIPTNNQGEPTNQVFRAYRYAADYAGLAGRDLTPQGTLE